MTPCPKCNTPGPAVWTKRTQDTRFRLEGVACAACGFQQTAPPREWRGIFDQDFAAGGVE